MNSRISAAALTAAFLTTGYVSSAEAAWRLAIGLTNAKAAASVSGVTIALGNEWTNGGWKIKRWNGSTLWSDAGGAAVSLTVSENQSFWAVSADNTIWHSSSATIWDGFPLNSCEDGSAIAIRQSTGDNSIAVGKNSDGSDAVYVISDGTTRWWNGSCWHRMPNLPASAPRDVAVYTSGTTNPYVWVAALDQTFYRWTGTQWVLVSGGTGVGVGGRLNAIGSDGASFWTYVPSTSSFVFSDAWTQGGILQIGSASKFPGSTGQPVRVLVAADGRVWVSDT